MKEGIAVPDAPWWQRYQAQVEFEFRLTPGTLSPRKWLFELEGKFERTYKGYHVWWPRGSIRVLGFWIGAAIFIRGKKI